MGYYSLIILRSHHRRSGSLSLWVREELSYCLSMRGVEQVDEDTVVGVLDAVEGLVCPLRKPIRFITSTSTRFEARSRENI